MLLSATVRVRSAGIAAERARRNRLPRSARAPCTNSSPRTSIGRRLALPFPDHSTGQFREFFSARPRNSRRDRGDRGTGEKPWGNEYSWPCAEHGRSQQNPGKKNMQSLVLSKLWKRPRGSWRGPRGASWRPGRERALAPSSGAPIGARNHVSPAVVGSGRRRALGRRIIGPSDTTPSRHGWSSGRRPANPAAELPSPSRSHPSVPRLFAGLPRSSQCVSVSKVRTAAAPPRPEILCAQCCAWRGNVPGAGVGEAGCEGCGCQVACHVLAAGLLARPVHSPPGKRQSPAPALLTWGVQASRRTR